MPKKLTVDEQKNLILNTVFDEEQEPAEFLNYLDHIGFDINAVENTKQLPDAVLGHYRLKQGEYDIDRAAMDLATYGPVAAAIVKGLAKQKSLAN